MLVLIALYGLCAERLALYLLPFISDVVVKFQQLMSKHEELSSIVSWRIFLAQVPMISWGLL